MENAIILTRIHGGRHLMELNNFTDAGHMLRKADRKPVNTLVEYLRENRNMKVYIGGSVVQNWLFQGRREYSDVDLLCTSSRDNALVLTRALSEYSRFTDLPKGTTRAYQTDGKLVAERPDDKVMQIENYRYLVQNQFLQKRYHGIIVDERFSFTPISSRFARLTGEIPSAIDLSIVSEDR